MVTSFQNNNNKNNKNNGVKCCQFPKIMEPPIISEIGDTTD